MASARSGNHLRSNRSGRCPGYARALCLQPQPAVSLAALIAFFGLGLALRSTWLLVAVPAVAVALTKLAIEPEEAYLERRFGEAYRGYKAQVRRWI